MSAMIFGPGDRVRVPGGPWLTVTAVGIHAFLAVGVAEDDPEYETTWMLDDAWEAT